MTGHYGPLRGNSREHGIAKLIRQGTPPRKIAKRTGVSLEVVKAVEAKIRKC